MRRKHGSHLVVTREWMILWPLTLIALVGHRAFAAEPEVIARWNFDTDGDTEGWTAGGGVADFTAADGKLRMKLTSHDAYIFGPPVSVRLDGCSVRVRLDCERSSHTQVYWLTDGQTNYGEHQVMTLNMSGSDPAATEWPGEAATVLDFAIGKPADAGRKLISFRIDPCNGLDTGTAKIDSIELLSQPPLLEANLATARHRIEANQAVPLTLSLRPIGGRSETSDYEVTFPDGGVQTLRMNPTDPGRASVDVRFDRPGVHQARASAAVAGGETQYDLETSIIVGEGQTLPLQPVLRSDQTRMDLVLASNAREVGAARWQIREGQGRWRTAGWLLPLAQLTVRQKNGSIVRRQPTMSIREQSTRRVRMEGRVSDLDDWQVQVDLEIVEMDELESVSITSVLRGPDDGQLLEFSGPSLRVDAPDGGDPLDRFALFGGLEMLEPGWPSSSPRAVGEIFADRWSPHPYKVTLPVMAIEAGGLTSTMMWQPLEPWAAKEALPTATFASPNLLDAQPNHLMRLSVPSIPRWVSENQAYAQQPYEMWLSRPLTVSCTLYAEAGLPVAMTARRWYQLFGTPLPPPDPHEDAALYEMIVRCYGDQIYWPSENGWRYHWYLGKDSAYLPDIAATLVAHAAQTGDRQWVQRTKLADRSIVDAAGSLATRLAADHHARALLAAMRPDATWPFRNTDDIRRLTRELTNGKHDSLGEDGSTSLGTCVQPALVILKQAKLSGNAELLAAGLKALEAMKRFRVPRGAQVWEVHQEIPDIRAAALAVEAYQIGHHLTTDTRWLDEANYWAWTGVQFAYAWHVPIERVDGSIVITRDRDDWLRHPIPLNEAYQHGQPQVTPFGTVPVLGPTFYVVNWFGVLVQWCGLEWAQKVIELDADRPDPLLRYIADGVVTSGFQQMCDQGPWTGLYPDSWHTTVNVAHAAMIYPGLLLKCRQAQERMPRLAEPWTRVLHSSDGRARWHVSGWGRPVSMDTAAMGTSWSAVVSFLPGQPNELILAGIEPPKTVRIAGELLDRAPDDSSSDRSVWRYAADRHALIARFPQVRDQMTIRVDW